MPDYLIAHSADDYHVAENLFSTYAGWLGIDLGFQHFEEELKSLKKMYSIPSGGIILCKEGGQYIGCVALRKIDKEIAELKRMFVLREYQQKGIGNSLLQKAIELARQCGYQKIRLDTLDHMKAAIALYKKYGFYETVPYYHNPMATAVYFELKL